MEIVLQQLSFTMNYPMIKKLVPLLILLLSVNGCAFFSSSSSKSKPSNGERLPKAPATVVPGGSGNNWRYIGTSSDGQLVVEIDDNSIHKTLKINQITAIAGDIINCIGP